MIATLFLQILFTTQVKIKTLPCCCNRIMSVQYIPFLTSLSFFFFSFNLQVLYTLKVVLYCHR